MDGLGRTVATTGYLAPTKSLILPARNYLVQGRCLYSLYISTSWESVVMVGLELEDPLGCYQMIICLLSIIIRVLVASPASEGK